MPVRRLIQIVDPDKGHWYRKVIKRGNPMTETAFHADQDNSNSWYNLNLKILVKTYNPVLFHRRQSFQKQNRAGSTLIILNTCICKREYRSQEGKDYINFLINLHLENHHITQPIIDFQQHIPVTKGCMGFNHDFPYFHKTSASWILLRFSACHLHETPRLYRTIPGSFNWSSMFFILLQAFHCFLYNLHAGCIDKRT